MGDVINIRRDVTDKFYRYKMPKLLAKIEGKGNGIKTVIPNMSDIAKALARPPSYPTKFFGAELGTQVKMDEKNERYIINGAHDAEKLASLLDVFIEKFVLCGSCKNPETEFIFTKDDEILKDCKACGAHLPVDMRHKIVTFILKNRPVEKKDKYKQKNDRAATAAEEEGADNTLEDDLNALPTAEERQVDENDWAVDTSAGAVEARMKDLSVSGAVSKLMDQDQTEDPLELFAEYLSNPDLSDEDIVNRAEELGVREDKAATVLAQVLLTEDVLEEEQIKHRASLFQYFVKDEKSQKGLLGGIERLVCISYPSLLRVVSLIFKELFFNDLVQEEVFLAWNEKVSKKYVADKKLGKQIREYAAPFIDWLKTAEEASDLE